MRVVLSYEDGNYYLRQFRSARNLSDYIPPPAWEDQAIQIPDYVVVAYDALAAQVSTMNTLLAMFDNEREENTNA